MEAVKLLLRCRPGESRDPLFNHPEPNERVPAVGISSDAYARLGWQPLDVDFRLRIDRGQLAT
jgi:hypothetical protein